MLKCISLTAMLLSGLLAWATLNTPERAHAGGDKDASKDAPASVAYNDTRQIAIAFDLVDLGRTAKAPDLLISAARILRRIETQDGDEKGEVGGGTDEPGIKTNLKTVAKELLSEAVKMAPDNKTIAELAQHAADEKLVVPPEPGARGSMRGARQHFHKPATGVSVTWKLKFVGGQPAAIAVRGNGRNILDLRVSGADGVNLYWLSQNPSLTWVPMRNAAYTITVTNKGPGPVAYTMFHN
jgi:hypothetical protein